ncbi:hypothetical protein LZ554_006201 [Drepanopeziza brunnea f. sp. 'monogermtubi']|nr:hypothetical protein LZ554_006201 [Drepanopeziza brunnea f. sp. 'monogermtubi']
MDTSATSQEVQMPPLEPNKDPAPPSKNPAFICSICWQRQPRGSKPKLLGASARIVCRACWRAVIDLSICWVCGECVVRGDEVVSLGWCFWHSACFGCLVCGTKLDVPGSVKSDISCTEESTGNRSGEWGKWSGSKEAGCAQGRTRCIGIELDEIPMCGVCEVENAGETTDRVLERGLETVTKSDGGLSRIRLNMLSGVGDEKRNDERHPLGSSPRGLKRFGGAFRTEERLNSCPGYRSKRNMSESQTAEDLKPLLEDAAEMGMAQDGSIDDSYYCSDTELSSVASLPSPRTFQEEDTAAIVYVSITDPVGEPAFKPSKTKPLPRWMHLLPNNVHRERERKANPAEAKVHRNSHEQEPMGTYYSSDGFDERDLDAIPSGSEDQQPPSKRQKQGPTRIDLPTVAIPGTKSRASISFDMTSMEGNRCGDKVSRTARRSHTVESDYMTAPESAAGSQRSRAPTPFPRTPHPSVSRPPIRRNDTSSYFSHRASIDTQEDSIDDLSCLLPPLVSPQPSRESAKSSQSSSSVSTNDPNLCFQLPSQSSEYIERYQPKQPLAAKFAKYVAAEPEPILEKIKRQRPAEDLGGDPADESNGKMKSDVKGKVKAWGLADGEDGYTSPSRLDLNRELKNLFRGV